MKNKTKNPNVPGRKERVKWTFPRLKRMFDNNRFLFVLSLILALLLWIFLAFNDTEHYPKRISDVPISITLSDEAQQKGLRVFSPDRTDTVNVFVRGNTLLVNQIDNTDLQAVAENVSELDSPGEYTVDLVARATGNLSSNVEVSSLSPASVKVYIDYAAEENMPVTLPTTLDPIDTDQYYSPGPAVDVDSVTISGPDAEVSRIDHLGIRYTPGSTPLTSTKTFDADVIAYDADGEVLELSDYVTLDPARVTVTIQVQPKKTVTVTPTFTNMPDSLDLDPGTAFTVNPSSVEIAGPKETLDGISEVSLEPIDASQIDENHTSFTQKVANLPTGCTIVSSGNTATVTLNRMDQYTSQQMTCTQFTTVNTPTGMTASVVTTSVPVTIVGKAADLQNITNANLMGTVDLSSVTEPGTATVPMTVRVGSAPCWAYGTYQVQVVVARQNAA